MYIMKISGNESAANTQIIGSESQFEQSTGLTIRQEIAARAMSAIISGAFANNTEVSPVEAAKLAFEFAEGFINESNSREGSSLV